MKLYRGQPYGAAIGRWWTPFKRDAQGYARVRRSYIVLCIDVPDHWVGQFRDQGTTRYYMIPPHRLIEGSTSARVVDGMVDSVQWAGLGV